MANTRRGINLTPPPLPVAARPPRVEVQEADQEERLRNQNPLDIVPFFDRPMSSGPSDRPTGRVDEFGNILYGTPTGVEYSVREDENAERRNPVRIIREDVLPAAQEYLQDPTLPSLEQSVDFAKNIAQGVYQQIEGAVSGTGTYGDVFELVPQIAAVSATQRVPEGAIRIFGGFSAATDPGRQAGGRRLPVTIGADGLRRFEIDDSVASFVPDNVKVLDVSTNWENLNLNAADQLSVSERPYSFLDEVIEHPELFRQYPELGDIRVVVDSSLSGGENGYFNSAANLIAVSRSVAANPRKFARTLLHEIQHGVQNLEGFDTGASPNLENTFVTQRALPDLTTLQNIKNTSTAELLEYDFDSSVGKVTSFLDELISDRESRIGIPDYADRTLVDNLQEKLELVRENPLNTSTRSELTTSIRNVFANLRENQDRVSPELRERFKNDFGISLGELEGIPANRLDYFLESNDVIPVRPERWDNIIASIRFDTYEGKSGEIEARNVSNRMDLSIEDRFDLPPGIFFDREARRLASQNSLSRGFLNRPGPWRTDAEGNILEAETPTQVGGLSAAIGNFLARRRGGETGRNTPQPSSTSMSSTRTPDAPEEEPTVNAQMSNVEYDARWSRFDEENTTPEDWQTAVRQFVTDSRDVDPVVRTPELEQSTRDLLEGRITREEHLRNVDEYKPVNPWDQLPREPSDTATVFSLKPNQRSDGRFILPEESAQRLGVQQSSLNVGDRFNGRLDIPAYNTYDTWIVAGTSPAESGSHYAKAIHYGSEGDRPVRFLASNRTSERIGSGEIGKTGYATVSGIIEDLDVDAIRARAAELLNDPEWTQVGFDPRRQGGFYVRSGENRHVPVREADEVIQIGPLVLAKNARLDPEYQGYNKGGMAMDDQMKNLLEEGGLTDDGMDRDPVSGNEVPSGSMAKEVRDDIPAQLSEGEYVVPADVVRYYGVQFFEKLRGEAKEGLNEMEETGRIGGEPVEMAAGGMAPTSDFRQSYIQAQVPNMQQPQGYAVGGTVGNILNQVPNLQFSQDNTTETSDQGMYLQTPYSSLSDLFADFSQVGGYTQRIATGAPVPTAPTTPTTPSPTDTTGTIEYRTYVGPNGQLLMVPFLNGEPQIPIPAGFVPQGQAPQVSSGDDNGEPPLTGQQRVAQRLAEIDEALEPVNYEDPLAAGAEALEGNRKIGTIAGAVIGSLAFGPIGGLLGRAFGQVTDNAGMIADAAVNAEVASILGYDSTDLDNQIMSKIEETSGLARRFTENAVSSARLKAREAIFNVDSPYALTRDKFQSEEAFESAMTEVAPAGMTYQPDTGSYTRDDDSPTIGERTGRQIDTSDSGNVIYAPTSTTPRPVMRPANLGTESSVGRDTAVTYDDSNVGKWGGDRDGDGVPNWRDFNDGVGFRDNNSDGSGSTEGSGKIVCTAMNASYGFGSYRQAIWLKYSETNLTEYHEKGYHKIFLPLVDRAYNRGENNSKVLRVILENIARHRTADLRAEMQGRKRDKLGRVYRTVLEPVCYIVGILSK